LAIGAVKNAFGIYFQFLEAGKKNFTKVEANNRKKQADLNDQFCSRGLYSEVYRRNQT
jgi:hypothetical protein